MDYYVQLLDRLIKDKITPSYNIALSFVEHLAWKAPKADPQQSIAAYIGFTQNLGVAVSAKLLEALIRGGVQSISDQELMHGGGEIPDSTHIQKAVQIFMKDVEVYEILPSKV